MLQKYEFISMTQKKISRFLKKNRKRLIFMK